MKIRCYAQTAALQSFRSCSWPQCIRRLRRLGHSVLGPTNRSQPLLISTTVLPGGQVGPILSGFDGRHRRNAAVSLVALLGDLPNGLTINSSSGVISGQPARQGAFGFRIELQDSSASEASVQSQMSMQIAAAAVRTAANLDKFPS